MRAAYLRLHELGYAHSAETWMEGELRAALYGVAIGRMFYGESMFARVRDASKIAHGASGAAPRASWLRHDRLPDAHRAPARLGARAIPRSEFSLRLRELVDYDVTPDQWTTPEANSDVAA